MKRTRWLGQHRVRLGHQNQAVNRGYLYPRTVDTSIPKPWIPLSPNRGYLYPRTVSATSHRQLAWVDSVDSKELSIRMIDKEGKVLYTVTKRLK
ncbi:MAG: hypothetical protein LBN06_01515 [Prevotellaceae bacterium]|nr:hypothetical protein [Prevotellaceae bacterium]